jgi:hypothetical protein
MNFQTKKNDKFKERRHCGLDPQPMNEAGAEAKLVLTMPCKEEEDHAQSPHKIGQII